MTAIRNFPDAPMARRKAVPLQWQVPAFAVVVWRALYRFGQRRAARELALLADRQSTGDPARARELRLAAAACRREADADRG
jgi:hypothetical protein